MTAVEWLEKELNEKGKLTAVDFYQAKAMEKQQIIDAYSKGLVNGGMDYKKFNNGIHYFFETYENK